MHRNKLLQNWTYSPIGVLVLRLLSVYLLYMLSRICYFIFNFSLFPPIPFSDFSSMIWGAFRFDTTAILYTNILVILMLSLPFVFRYRKIYQTVVNTLFVVCNSVAFAANIADIGYFPFTLRRTTTTIFQEFENESWSRLLPLFVVDYWYLLLLLILFVIILIWVVRSTPLRLATSIKPLRYYSLQTVGFIFIVLSVVGGIRGGLGHSVRPITLSNASAYVSHPAHRDLILNTPFALIRTIGKRPLSKEIYFESIEEMQRYFDPQQLPNDTLSTFGATRGRNVMVIVLESFGRELSHHFNRHNPKHVGYTPFLDSLMSQGYTFERSFANGRKSIDALPSTLVSIPSIQVPFILSSYSGNTIHSIASLLKEEGYSTAFFHGAPNGSMGFDAFARQTGHDRYYGKDEYNNNAHYDGIWGIWDLPFLQFTANTLNTLPQPFYATLFTLSSHHPFNVPSEFTGVFPKGTQPLHQCAGYTDRALREFFATAKSQSWYDNTLFVIVGDHTSCNESPQYNTSMGQFAVPIIFFAPNTSLIGYNDTTVVQQSDILPTVMQLVGYNSPYIAFGNNIFDPNKQHFALNSLGESYQFIMDDYVMLWNNGAPTALYQYTVDSLMTNNILEKEAVARQRLSLYLKAIMQSYTTRMIENDLVVK